MFILAIIFLLIPVIFIVVMFFTASKENIMDLYTKPRPKTIEITITIEASEEKEEDKEEEIKKDNEKKKLK